MTAARYRHCSLCPDSKPPQVHFRAQAKVVFSSAALYPMRWNGAKTAFACALKHSWGGSSCGPNSNKYSQHICSLCDSTAWHSMAQHSHTSLLPEPVSWLTISSQLSIRKCRCLALVSSSTVSLIQVLGRQR